MRKRWLLGGVGVAAASAAIWLATRDRELGSPKTTDSTPHPMAAATAGSLHVRRVDPITRARLLAQIHAAENAAGRGPTASGASTNATTPGTTHAAPSRPSLPDDPDLDMDYIRDAVKALQPMLADCYDRARDTNPTLGVTIAVGFTIEGEADIGGLVRDSAIIDSESDVTDPAFRECIQETMYGLEIDPPAAGNTLTVTTKFRFAPSAPK